MLQVIPKWKVTVTFGHGTSQTQTAVWISDHFISNVLRQVSAMDFSANGLDQPTSIEVAAAHTEQP